MESSPINYNDLSDSSYLNTLTVPLGNGMPNPTEPVLLNIILLDAWRLS